VLEWSVRGSVHLLSFLGHRNSRATRVETFAVQRISTVLFFVFDWLLALCVNKREMSGSAAGGHVQPFHHFQKIHCLVTLILLTASYMFRPRRAFIRLYIKM